MKLNFRNRKFPIALSKNQLTKIQNSNKKQISKQQQGQTNFKRTHDDNKQKHYNPNNKSSKLGQSNIDGSRLSQSRQTFPRIQMNHSKQSYVDSIADMIHLIGQQYINYLNQGKQQKFYGLILSNLSKLQARDRRIIVQYNFRYNHQNQVIFDFQKEQQNLRQWLGQMHFKVVSISFDFLINKYLSYEQVKVYCSQNLLLNIMLFLAKLKGTSINFKNNGSNNGNNNKNYVQHQNIQTSHTKSITDLMFLIDEILNKNLQYLMIKYPQVKQIKVNKRLRSQIQPINNIQNDNNDMLQYSNIKFEYNQKQDYNSQIMKFINYLIQKMSEEIQIQGKKHTYAEGFYQTIQDIFQTIYLPQLYLEELRKNASSRQQYKQSVQQLFQINKQVKQYKEKVLKYTSYKIGTKINPNAELFSQSDIKGGFFEVKSTSILRILTKWIQQLQRKIFRAKQQIHKRSFRFKNNQKGFSKLNASQKNDLYIEAIKQVENLKRFILEIRQNAFHIQGQLASTINRSKQNLNIPLYQYLVGQFSSKLQDTASSSLLSYLNKLIHVLISIPLNIKQKYQHDQDLLKQIDVNLITFKIADLLRCKISSHQAEIIRIYKMLKQISENKQYFKIIRIKDRLQLGTRDILINVLFNNRILCQIQLAVTDEIDNKQQSYDLFNHYLYELKRSSLGPIMQSACIWAHFDQRSRIYKKIKQKQIQKYYLQFNKQTNIQHNCAQQMIQNNLPFICSNCQKFYYSQKGIIKHKKCNQCKKYYQCSLCIQKQLTQEKLKQFLGLSQILGIFNQEFVKWNSYQYPKNGLIIPKKSKSIAVFFFTTILWKQDAYLIRSQEVKDKAQKVIQIIVKLTGNQLKQWNKLKQNYIIYQWKQKRNINRTIKPSSVKLEIQSEERRKKIYEQQKRLKMQKQIQQIKKKWKIKNKNKSRGNSAESKGSRKSKTSKNSQISKAFQNQEQENLHENSNQNTQTQIQTSNIINKHQKQANKKINKYQMPKIDEQKLNYNQNFSKKSKHFQFRVAVKQVLEQDDDTKQQNYLVLGPYFPQDDIRMYLRNKYNAKLIKQNLQNKIEVLFLEDLRLQKIQLNQKEKTNYMSSLSEITQIYLDSNSIEDIQFIQSMPKLKVLHINYNYVRSMDSLQKLTGLTQVMLQYNHIYHIEGTQNNHDLVWLNLNGNPIQYKKTDQRKALENLRNLFERRSGFKFDLINGNQGNFIKQNEDIFDSQDQQI